MTFRHGRARDARASGDDGERGAVIPIVVISLVFLMVMTAFTVDLGRLMLRRRDLQQVADVVSLDLARRVDGRTVDQIEADPAWVTQQHLSAERNDFPIGESRSLDVQLGHVLADHSFVRDFGATVPNAVKVTAFDRVEYFFAPGGANTNRHATAIGSGPPANPAYISTGSLDYQVGSFLAGVTFTPQRTGFLNRVLGGAFGNGGGFSIDALSYQGLASSTVTLRQITTQLGLASPNDFFTSSINARRFFLASAQALAANGGDVASVNALNALASGVNSSSSFSGGALIDDGSKFSATASQGGTSAADVALNVLDLIQGEAFLVNGANAISVPSFDLGIPGLTNTTMQLSVIEGPRFALGRVVGDDPTTTSQVHLVLTTNVDLPVTTPTLTGARLTGTVTVDVTAGSASAFPTAIACPDSATGTLGGTTLTVTASPLAAKGSQALTMSATLPLLGSINVLSSTVTNATVATTTSGGSATFSYTSQFMPPTGTGTTQRVGGGTLNLSGALGATSANSAVLGGTVPLADLLNAFNTGLSTSLVPALTTSAIPFIGDSLGLQIGGADVGANELHCSGPILVG